MRKDIHRMTIPSIVLETVVWRRPETAQAFCDFQKNLNSLTAFFGPKICFFLRYAHITHFFGLWQPRLNEIISSPCPQVTLDTFGFLVGARWAARRAVFWPRLPKNGPFWAGNAIFSTLCPYNPLFWAQTDSDQWDHIFPISQGNFRCLRFSGRCPFVRSAGRFLAPIAQNGPFLG